MEKGEIGMPKTIVGSEQWIKNGITGKEPCLFSYAEIYYVIRTMYPKMDQLELRYLTNQIRKSDWLKTDNHWDTLRTVIKEQIREMPCEQRKGRKKRRERMRIGY